MSKLRFTNRAWSLNQDIYKKILHHNYTRELYFGHLCRNIFRKFMVNDYYYMRNSSKCWFNLHNRAIEEGHSRFFHYKYERSKALATKIKQEYFKAYNLYEFSHDILNKKYNDFLFEVSDQDSIGVALAALSPCHLLYINIAKDITIKSGNEYKEWIKEGYLAPRNSAEKLVALINSIYDESSTAEQMRMFESFRTSMKMELDICNMVYPRLSISSPQKFQNQGIAI